MLWRNERRPARRMVGLDVGETHIAGAQLCFAEDGTFLLEAAGWLPRPPAADCCQTADIVRDLFQQTGLAMSPVCVAIQCPALVVKHYHYPHLPAGEVEPALMIEAEETLQMPRGAIYLDWHANAVVAAPDETPAADGVLVAAPKAEVEAHLQMLAQAGIFPRVVDAGCLAVCNLYMTIKGPASSGHAVCIVSLSDRRADIAVLSPERGIFPRTVFSPLATWNETEAYLTECVADTLNYHQFKLHGPPVEHLVLTGTVPRSDQFAHQLRDLVPRMNVWNPLSELPNLKPRLQRLAENESGAVVATGFGLALRRT